MKIQLMSDLHFEFHQDGGAGFIDQLKGEADVLVLAGDICNGRQLPEVMERFGAKYSRIVYVHGNHEFYGTDRQTVVDKILKAEKLVSGLYWLDCDDTEVGGQRIVGTPLWFEHNPTAPTWALSDFDQIANYRQWVYQQNKAAKEFLFETVRSDDIIVTHHLPSERSVHPAYQRSPINAFFVCGLDTLIKARQPKLWIHGHTHFLMDYQIGPTRVLCNPLGYPDSPNPQFNDNLVVEV